MVQNRQTTVAAITNLDANHKGWLTVAVPALSTKKTLFKKNAIHQSGSVCIGENCALSLEYCPWLCYPRPGAQFFSIQTSCLANNIYLLYKLLCCAQMCNPKNSHDSTLVKLPYFFTCLISPISCWHIDHFLQQSVRLMNEPG